MQGSEGGGGFWSWLLGGGFWAALTGAVSVGVGMVGGAWAARGTLAAIEQKNALQDLRLDALERDREALRDMASNIAVLTALQSEMKDDVQAIFERLNRRADDQPNTKERRKNGERYDSSTDEQ